MPIDIFKSIVSEEQLDSNFRYVSGSKNFDSAKGILNEIFNSWEGFDEHFLSEFQSTGFNARLFELYLYATFKSLGFDIERCPEGRPDFCLTKNNQKLFVEAVTTNPSNDEDDFIANAFEQEAESIGFLKLRHTLLSKLKKKYWELPWVQGCPFVIALSPFHSAQALNMTDFEVRKYLYGVTIKKEIVDGSLKLTEARVENHVFGAKSISNFFDIPLTSNISGILFSNEAAIGKFMRMGYQAHHGEKIHLFYYSGSCYHEDPNSIGIAQFMVEIDRDEKRKYTDEWRFGLTLFHNHKATVPIGFELMQDVTQTKYEEAGGLFTSHLSFHPYNAKNLRLATR